MTEDSEVWSTLNRTAVSYDSKERSEPEIEMIFVYVEKLFVSLIPFLNLNLLITLTLVQHHVILPEDRLAHLALALGPSLRHIPKLGDRP